MDGIVNVYKEKGYTSHDVVAKMRGILRMKKIGHTGTLDPEAEGVLPICLGRATRVCGLLADETKTYQAVLLLGVETDTQDFTGEILARSPVEATPQQVRQAVLGFLGPYLQTPPMYSALKVNGKRLYELARQGRQVERAPREVRILDIQISELCLPRVRFGVTCTKGTYIRTLCHDIGERLGCGGCMEALERTRVGRFRVEDSLRLEKIEALRDRGELEAFVTPVDELFSALPALATLPDPGDKLVHNGNPFEPGLAVCADPGELCPEMRTGRFGRARVYDSAGAFIGIYGYDEAKGRYQPQTLFLGGSERDETHHRDKRIPDRRADGGGDRKV